MLIRIWAIGYVAVAGCSSVPTTMLPGGTTVFFDGAEGVGEGATSFSFGGASFAGGTIRTVGDFSLYGSGRFAYEVRSGSVVTVQFDSAIDFLELVFIERGGDTVLRAFDAQDNEVGTVTAGTALVAQMVALSGDAVRIEVEHSGGGDGWIDNFTFRIAS